MYSDFRSKLFSSTAAAAKRPLPALPESARPAVAAKRPLPAIAAKRPLPALPESARPAVAGLLGGGVSTLLLHPLDLLKTRQAVHTNGADAAERHKYARLGRAVSNIVKSEGGLKGLYSGVGANVAVSGASWGIYFLA